MLVARKTMGKRTKRLLGDLDQTSVNPELKQMLDSRSDASNRLAEPKKTPRSGGNGS